MPFAALSGQAAARTWGPEWPDDQQRADRARATEDRARATAERASDRELRDYERAQQALERAEWAAAVERFRAIAATASTRADAATYWQATRSTSSGSGPTR